MKMRLVIDMDINGADIEVRCAATQEVRRAKMAAVPFGYELDYGTVADTVAEEILGDLFEGLEAAVNTLATADVEGKRVFDAPDTDELFFDPSPVTIAEDLLGTLDGEGSDA